MAQEDFKILIEGELDKKSIEKIKSQLLKESIKINVDFDVTNKEIEKVKQLRQKLLGGISKINITPSISSSFSKEIDKNQPVLKAIRDDKTPIDCQIQINENIWH